MERTTPLRRRGRSRISSDGEESVDSEHQRTNIIGDSEDPDVAQLRAAWNTPAGTPHRSSPPRAHKSTPAAVLRAFDTARELTVAQAAALDHSEPSMHVWRCLCCPLLESVCCRIGEGRRCLCGHKSKEHDRTRGGRCSACPCSSFEFHVQFPGFELKCKCKHKHTDHSSFRRGKGSRLKRRCLKEGCGCDSFHATWTCNCGHGWASHVTVPYRGALGPRAREWTAPGVSREVVEQAARRRERWAREGKLPAGASETAAAMALAAAAARRREARAQGTTRGADAAAPLEATPEALASARAVLGLPSAAASKIISSEDVRRAFKRSSLETHPDKGGSAVEFQRVKDAHDVLMCIAVAATDGDAAASRGGASGGGP